jgi:hypothetical protein
MKEVDMYLCPTCDKPYRYSEDAQECCPPDDIEPYVWYACEYCEAAYECHLHAEECEVRCKEKFPVTVENTTC